MSSLRYGRLLRYGGYSTIPDSAFSRCSFVYHADGRRLWYTFRRMISLLIAATLLTRLSDVRALSPAEFAEGRDVAITGCVTAVLKSQSCLIEDDTGRFMFQMEKGPKPPAGAVIAATGRTQLDRKNGIRQESVVFTSADIIGIRAPSRPCSSIADLSRPRKPPTLSL